MRSTDEYIALIPPLNAGKAKFVATVTATVSPFADNQTFLASIPAAFDIDSAVGVQLDVDGQWIGRSRDIAIPIVQKWFSLGIPGQGIGQAPFRGPTILASKIEQLNDTDYRRLLKAKRSANYSDGTVTGAQAALSIYFTAPTLVFVVDRGVAIRIKEPPPWLSLGIAGRGLGEGIWKPKDPTKALDSVPNQPTASLDWTIGVTGTLPNAVDLEILAQDLITVHPAGVKVKVRVTTVNGAPLFGLGMQNQYVSGLGSGAWGRDPEYVIQHIL